MSVRARRLSAATSGPVSRPGPAQTERAILTGKPIENLRDAEGAAREFRERGIGFVVVTLRRLEALVAAAGEALPVPAIKVDAVDPTCAGNAFTAALAIDLAKAIPCATPRIGERRCGACRDPNRRPGSVSDDCRCSRIT